MAVGSFCICAPMQSVCVSASVQVLITVLIVVYCYTGVEQTELNENLCIVSLLFCVTVAFIMSANLLY